MIGKTPWSREWLPTPVFLPGEFHEQRSLVGYSPWAGKESDMTEGLPFIHTLCDSDLQKIVFDHKHNQWLSQTGNKTPDCQFIFFFLHNFYEHIRINKLYLLFQAFEYARNSFEPQIFHFPIANHPEITLY